METILRYVIIAAVGALASILANQSIAVFNDGLRPVLPEYLEKRMDRKALAATSFAIGFGLVIGYGLPTSIAASIILIHCILLTTDYELRHRHRPADRRHPGCSGNHAHDGSVHHRGILVHQQVQQEASGLHGGRSSGRDPGRPDRKRAVPAVSVHPCRLIPG